MSPNHSRDVLQARVNELKVAYDQVTRRMKLELESCRLALYASTFQIAFQIIRCRSNRSGTHPTGSALRTGQGEVLPLPFIRLWVTPFRQSSPSSSHSPELNPGPSCYTCSKPVCRGMDYLQCQANSCTNGSHKQIRWSGFHRSQLTNS